MNDGMAGSWIRAFEEGLKCGRIETLKEVEQKFLELGKQGEESPLKHNVEFYRWLSKTIDEECNEKAK